MQKKTDDDVPPLDTPSSVKFLVAFAKYRNDKSPS